MKKLLFKRLISLFSLMITMLQIIPLAVGAEANETVYSASRMYSTYDFIAYGIDFTVESDDKGKFFHGVASKCEYSNDGLNFNLTPPDISLAEYKFIKLVYRTDSDAPFLDATIRSPRESWLNKKPSVNGDGQWHEVIFNLDNMTGGAGVLPAGHMGATFRIKPFGTQSVTLESEKYFDIRYIACFKSEADANNFVYDEKEHEYKPGGSFEFSEASDKLIDKYMTEIDALIDEIVYSPTTVEVTGTKYYVSVDGSDSNDGLSPESAWKSIEKVSSFSRFEPGDGVFLKRGDTWRITSPLKVADGVTYSAYGTGAKPKLICSIDASDPTKWTLTEYPNVYAFKERIGSSKDIGTIVFDGGDAWGIKVSKTTEDMRVDNGTVFNGLEWQTVPVGEFKDQSGLKGDLEFYHNWEDSTVYVYSKDGNPATRFSSIELTDKGYGINGDGKDNVIIDNIEIFGTSTHGIHFDLVTNLTVQYCTFKWIGGALQYNDGRTVRYGNAVECFALDNYTVHHCYASQIYDCCYTSQSSKPIISNNITAYKNVSEFCNTGLEFWNLNRTGEAGITNIKLYDNYTRFAGYGWSHQRPNKDGNFFYGATNTSLKFEGNNIYNNVNLFASKYALKVAAVAPTQYNFHDNVYIMEDDKYLGYMVSNPGTGTGNVVDHPYTAEAISKAVNAGFEKGGRFYYTKTGLFGNMYDLYTPLKNTPVFGDIPDGFWGRSYINYVLDKGLYQGISKFEFAPGASMTRSMTATVLMRMADGKAGKSKLPYTDVNADAWYNDSVRWAYENGIVPESDKFRPDENITREELADMLYRFAGSPEINAAVLDFTDMDKITPDYKNALAFCVENKIINGYEDGSVKPENRATRAEVAAMIFRFKQAIR